MVAIAIEVQFKNRSTNLLFYRCKESFDDKTEGKEKLSESREWDTIDPFWRNVNVTSSMDLAQAHFAFTMEIS